MLRRIAPVLLPVLAALVLPACKTAPVTHRKQLAFLSDHPAGQTRIEDIQKRLPEAKAQYRPGGPPAARIQVLPPGTIPKPQPQDSTGEGRQGAASPPPAPPRRSPGSTTP